MDLQIDVEELRGCEDRHSLHLRRLGIDTYQEAVIYMRSDCYVCRSEGFESQSRILVQSNSRSVVATLNVVSNGLLAPGEAGLSEAAWRLLDAEEGGSVELAHPPPLVSLNKVRAKIYGSYLEAEDYEQIIRDIGAGHYSDLDIAAFLAACAGDRLGQDEIINLTKAVINNGERISWRSSPIMDKHTFGGLPGNRTSLIVVPIVTAYGLMMPKISSRAITSPAGTADTMGTLAPVNLTLAEMRRVVDREGGCIVWDREFNLSPADDYLIRVERALDLDCVGQMVASVLSKKVLAGSTHVVIDIPVDATARHRTFEAASPLGKLLALVGSSVGLEIHTIISDGSQPVGRGIGPSLEARDVLSVLRNEAGAPEDLRERALVLAGKIIEMSRTIPEGQGRQIATQILMEGRAWQKFLNICEGQGGFREPTRADFAQTIIAQGDGIVTNINNRKLAQVAKLAGAPRAKSAGLELHVPAGQRVEAGQPIYTIHAETQSELDYALDYAGNTDGITAIEEV